MPDLGNPNEYKIFAGKYLLTPNGASFTTRTIMLTSANFVIFQSDATVGNTENLCTLPQDCRPKNTVRFICPASTRQGKLTNTIVNVSPTGAVTFKQFEDENYNLEFSQNSINVTVPNSQQANISNIDTNPNTIQWQNVNWQITIPQHTETVKRSNTVDPISIVHLNGNSFNICDRWYQDETGAKE